MSYHTEILSGELKVQIRKSISIHFIPKTMVYDAWLTHFYLQYFQTDVPLPFQTVATSIYTWLRKPSGTAP